MPSLRIFHVRSCQYLKKTLNGLLICLTTFQHDVQEYALIFGKNFFGGKNALGGFILEGSLIVVIYLMLWLNTLSFMVVIWRQCKMVLIM